MQPPAGGGTYWASKDLTYVWSYTNVITHAYTPVGMYYGSFVSIEPKINFPQAGTYNIQVVAENQCGMSSVAQYQVTVTDCYGSYYSVSPNPARHLITIQAESMVRGNMKREGRLPEAGEQNQNDIRKVKVYDESGKLWIQQSFGRQRKQVQLDVSSLPPGFYVVKINNGGKYVETHKLVIGK